MPTELLILPLNTWHVVLLPAKRGFNVRVLAMCLASKGPDHVLQDIMKGIYKACKNAAKEYDTTLQAGANIAGFLKVAEAMVAQGM
jgi:hypothetical protein